MKLIENYTYGFEDFSLEPHALSTIFSRRDVDTSYRLNEAIKLETPIISSPMADVTDDRLALAISKAGGIGCIHRFQTIDQQSNMVDKVFQAHENCFAAVGTNEDFMERAIQCIEAGACGIIVDVAFLNHRTLKVCEQIRKTFPNIYLISGNVATGAGFRAGVDVGLNAIRVGIGNGQACRTSRVTGVGIGLLTSLMECYEEAQSYEGPAGFAAVICDGGMDVGGSFCKALAAGASMAIMGRAFAATWESPGRTMADTTHFSGGTLCEYENKALASPEQVQEIRNNGFPIYKEYRGSASMEAQLVSRARGDIITSEGVGSQVQVNGSVEDVLGRWNGALRSSMSYLGALNLNQYRDNAVFRRITQGVFNQSKARSLQSFEVVV